MDVDARKEAQRVFRTKAKIMVATDAAGEGINLQFCRYMINWDIPWNPNRLEQRMGRIHRYGQKHDPVRILNLIAPSTREGKVLKCLLDKLEKIRKQLKSDKVFDCIGRVYAGVSIKQYMEKALTESEEDAAHDLEGQLTPEQIEALTAREKALYGEGGDVAKELPRLRAELEQEVYFRLLPGYVRNYAQEAAPLLDLQIDGEEDGCFSLRPLRLGALDPLLPALEMYPEKARDRLSFTKPADHKKAIWLHPGEPVFECFRDLVSERLGDDGRKGSVFVDPTADSPYLFHMARLSVIRKADPEVDGFARQEVLDCRLVGIRQGEGSEITLCPVEHLLLLRGGHGLPGSAQRMAVAAEKEKELARSYLAERVAREMALQRKKELLSSLPERESFVRRGFDYQEMELAAARSRHAEKARSGNRKAIEALDDVKRQQRQLSSRRESAIAALRREPDLIAPGEIQFIAHALVVPSSDPAEIEQHRADVEMVAMQLAQVFEEAAGAIVQDVHTPELARKAGLQDNPGFDLLSHRPGNGKRAIEVKGRAATGDVEVSANEWAWACNMRDEYWLYAVYDCATPAPRLVRVQDPFGSLLAKAKGSVLVGARDVVEASGEQKERW